MCNHQSFLDIFIMYAMARSQFVAKKEVGKIPLGSSIIIAGQTLVVDRTSRKSSHLVLEKIRERAKLRPGLAPAHHHLPRGHRGGGKAVEKSRDEAGGGSSGAFPAP